MITTKKNIRDIFSSFHDGTIEDWSGDLDKLTLKISCPYLAERINNNYEYFYIDLIDITLIELETYKKDFSDSDKLDKKVTIIGEINEIFDSEIDIFRAETDNQFVEIVCWKINEASNYVGTKLKIACASICLFNQDKDIMTISELIQVRNDYWNDFRKRK